MEGSEKNNLIAASGIDDEILVRGEDNQWYILKGEELLPYQPGQGVVAVKKPAEENLPAPVSAAIPPPKKMVVITAERSPLMDELDRLINDTVGASGLNFSDPLLAKRFKILVSERLRDVKDALETKETFLRSIKIGGLGLKESEIARVLSLLEKNFKEFDKKWRELEERKNNEWKKKQAEDAVEKSAREKKKEIAEVDEMRFKLLARAGVKEKLEKVVAPKPSPLKPLIKTIATPPPPKHSPPSLFPAPSAPSPTAFRPKMIDVKFTPRLLSPIEELKEMKLIDFRRLSRDPKEIILKIKAKIDLLERESFTKKMQGIEAWKQSEPARLYRGLSGQALNSGKTIEQAIFEREKKEEPTLTAPEFYAIMELSKQLRF